MKDDNYLPLVSVIIPTFKRPGMLNRAIESVLNQTYENIEIIIVDDNNEDSIYRSETVHYMERYNQNSKIKYVKHQKNKGGSEARNTGINIASGKYISFLDDDDEYLPTKIEKQVGKFHESELANLGFVYCQMETYDENNLLIGITKNYYRGNRLPFEKNMVGTIAGTPSLMCLKSVLIEIGGFKPLKSGQDWYLILEMLERGYQCDFLDEILLKVYFHSKERISNRSSKIESLKERFEIKQRYFNDITPEFKKKIIYKHLIQIANHLKYIDKKESIEYFRNALKFKKLSRENLYFLVSILMKEEYYKKLKNVLLKNK